MGLLKTVFEVNLGLFGKKSQDGYGHSYSIDRYVWLISSEGHRVAHSYSS